MDILEIKKSIMKDFKGHKAEKLIRYKILNQSIIKGQTLFVGSSLMEQFPINELQQRLDEKHIIYNRGVSGFVIEELLSVMNTCIFELSPTKIFINIGTNDIAAADYNQEYLITNYNQVLKEIKQQLPECAVYIMSYYPVNSNAYFPLENGETREKKFKTRKNATLKAANKTLQLLAKKYDFKYIDVNEGLVDQEGNLKKNYTVEGIHLWPNAYSCIFNNLKKFL